MNGYLGREDPRPQQTTQDDKRDREREVDDSSGLIRPLSFKQGRLRTAVPRLDRGG